MKSPQRVWTALSSLSMAACSVALFGYPFASSFPIFLYTPYLVVGSSLLFSLPLFYSTLPVDRLGQRASMHWGLWADMLTFAVLQQLILAIHLYGFSAQLQRALMFAAAFFPTCWIMFTNPLLGGLSWLMGLALTEALAISLPLFSGAWSIWFSVMCVGFSASMLFAALFKSEHFLLFGGLALFPVGLLYLAATPSAAHFLFSSGLLYAAMIASVAWSVVALTEQVFPPEVRAQQEGVPEEGAEGRMVIVR